MDKPNLNDKQIPRKIDRYEIRDRIGAGGMGLIFKGYDTRLKRPVAIKLISDRVRDESVRRNIRERFFNEARAAGALSHPNIVQVYDAGEVNDVVFIVMEFVEGETLEQVLKSKGPLTPEQLIRVAREVSSGLSFAHQAAIVHRDIKPSNIIIEAKSGVAKILDFGIAKFIDEEEMNLTSTGMVLGSTHYLSPEHITGKNLDGRSDIFCLGTLLYESSTGMLPFRGSNSSTILYKIVHFDPPPPHEVKKDIRQDCSQIIMNCLKKKNTERYQKADDVIRAFDDLQKEIRSPTSMTWQRQGGGEAKLLEQSFFIRDSQLLSALVTQKKLNSLEASQYKGKRAYDAIIKDGLLTEDDLSATISECLQIPWISRGRLKGLRIDSAAFEKIPVEEQKKYFCTPFYLDEKTAKISLIIDGITDFQASPNISSFLQKNEFQIYLAGRNAILQLIESKEKGKAQDPGILADVLETNDFNLDKKILLLEPNPDFQQALVKLSSSMEKALSIVNQVEDAKHKLQTEKFHHVWVNRNEIGDELEFELLVLRNNPSSDIRVYENLGVEIFEDSVPYLKFREFFLRLLQIFLKQGSPDERKMAQNFGALAVKVAKAITQNQKELDEVYFAALFYFWEQSRTKGRQVSEIFEGIYKFQYIFECLSERFDGRGPLGLKRDSIPVASRCLAVLSLMLKINPHMKSWTATQFEKLKETFQISSGKQLDPLVTAQVLELIRPQEKNQAAKKIVLIDSDTEYSAQLKAHLKQVDLQATVYADGVSALAGIKKNPPDLIISEILVSKLDGFALAARLQGDEALKNIPLVFLSESKRADHSTKALQLGAQDFISKDSEPQFILAKLERLIS